MVEQVSQDIIRSKYHKQGPEASSTSKDQKQVSQARIRSKYDKQGSEASITSKDQKQVSQAPDVSRLHQVNYLAPASAEACTGNGV